VGKLEDEVKDMISFRYGSVPKFAKEVGVPEQTIYFILRKGFAGSSIDTVLPIIAELGLDPNWIVKNRLVTAGASDLDFIDVPLRGRVPAGEPVEMCPIDDYFPVPRQVMEREAGSFLLEVSSESMNKVLPKYCYALVNPNKTEIVDEEIYVVNINGNDATVKHVKRLNNGLELIPDSTDTTFQPKTYDFGKPETENIRIIGKVVWITFPFDYIMKKK
jgi:repressor LexA